MRVSVSVRVSVRVRVRVRVRIRARVRARVRVRVHLGKVLQNTLYFRHGHGKGEAWVCVVRTAFLNKR